MAEQRDWAAHVEAVAGLLLGQPNKAMSSPSEWRYGAKGSLAVHIKGEYRGTWHNFENDEGGGVLALVRHIRGGSLAEAATWLENELGLPKRVNGAVVPGVVPAAATAAPAPPLADVWHERFEACGTIGKGDPAGRYLLARGCALPHPAGDLRWHPEWPHPTGHRGPALVGAVTLVTDASVQMTLHQTWIKGDGSGAKAFDHLPQKERPLARLYLKGTSKTGGVLRLWPDDAVTARLGVAEGIETALTLARRVQPVWSCIDAGNLGEFPPLAGIAELIVAIDRDPAGVAAWHSLEDRWAGRRLVAVGGGRRKHDINDWRTHNAEE